MAPCIPYYLADHHDPGPDRRAHDLAHVHDVDGQESGEPERVGDRQENERRVVRHIGEGPDEHPGQRRGNDQRLAPADLVSEPAEGVAADHDADPDLEGVQDVVLAVSYFLGRQPDVRVHPRGNSVGGGRDGPAHLHEQAYLPGHDALGQAVDPSRHLAGNDQRAACGGPGSRGVLCHDVLLAAIQCQGVVIKGEERFLAVLWTKTGTLLLMPRRRVWRRPAHRGGAAVVQGARKHISGEGCLIRDRAGLLMRRPADPGI